MAQFQRIDVVEARQYDGPRLTVVSESLGEQTANAGDWLLGSEKGRVTVKSAAAFESEGWKLYSATPQDDEIAVLSKAVESLKADKATLEAFNSAVTGERDTLKAQNADLASKVSDTIALKAQVDDLTDKLAASKADSDAKASELTTLKAHLQAFTDAQAKVEAEQAAVQKAIS
jgi:hypothetical protein